MRSFLTYLPRSFDFVLGFYLPERDTCPTPKEALIAPTRVDWSVSCFVSKQFTGRIRIILQFTILIMLWYSPVLRMTVSVRDYLVVYYLPREVTESWTSSYSRPTLGDPSGGHYRDRILRCLWTNRDMDVLVLIINPDETRHLSRHGQDVYSCDYSGDTTVLDSSRRTLVSRLVTGRFTSLCYGTTVTYYTTFATRNLFPSCVSLSYGSGLAWFPGRSLSGNTRFFYLRLGITDGHGS